MVSTVSDEASEVTANDAVPGRALALIELDRMGHYGFEGA